MKEIVLLVILLSSSLVSVGQKKAPQFFEDLKTMTRKGDYLILEVRLNSEDEFRTIEGSNSSLARLAVFTGKNRNNEIISKGFEGMNEIVNYLNQFKQKGWVLVDVYPVKGQSLLITHYVLERKK